MNEVIIVSSKEELLGQGYIYENIGKEFILLLFSLEKKKIITCLWNSFSRI